MNVIPKVVVILHQVKHRAQDNHSARIENKRWYPLIPHSSCFYHLHHKVGHREDVILIGVFEFINDSLRLPIDKVGTENEDSRINE